MHNFGVCRAQFIRWRCSITCGIFTGFGNFGLRYVPEHQGRNPKTGESLTVPAGYYPIFKAGKGLKDRVAKCQRIIEDEPADTPFEPPETAGPKPKRALKKKKTDEPVKNGLHEASQEDQEQLLATS